MTTAERQPAAVLRFFLPLPVDTGLPHGDLTTRVEIAEGRLTGWEDADVAPWLGKGLFLGQDVSPVSTLVLRRAQMRELSASNELSTVTDAFPEDFENRDEIRTAETVRDEALPSRTVAKLLVICAEPAWDYDRDWIWSRFLRVFRFLNDYLFLTAWAARSPVIEPLRPCGLAPSDCWYAWPARASGFNPPAAPALPSWRPFLGARADRGLERRSTRALAISP